MGKDYLDSMLESMERNVGASSEHFESESYEVEHALVEA